MFSFRNTGCGRWGLVTIFFGNHIIFCNSTIPKKKVLVVQVTAKVRQAKIWRWKREDKDRLTRETNKGEQWSGTECTVQQPLVRIWKFNSLRWSCTEVSRTLYLRDKVILPGWAGSVMYWTMKKFINE